jgi:hypothetical protein
MNINFFADLFCLAFTGAGDFGVFHIIESLFDSGSYRCSQFSSLVIIFGRNEMPSVPFNLKNSDDASIRSAISSVFNNRGTHLAHTLDMFSSFVIISCTIVRFKPKISQMCEVGGLAAWRREVGGLAA